MQHYDKVNLFFKNYVYNPSLNFALSPISWAFNSQDNDGSNFWRKALLVSFAPFFMELAAATSAIALAVISSVLFVHAIAAITAGLIDICSEVENNNQFRQQRIFN